MTDEQIDLWSRRALAAGIALGILSAFLALLWPVREYVLVVLLALAVMILAFIIGFFVGIIIVFLAWLVYAFRIRVDQSLRRRALRAESKRIGEQESKFNQVVDK